MDFGRSTNRMGDQIVDLDVVDEDISYARRQKTVGLKF